MSYGGDVSPLECWERLSSDQGGILIDVRTRAEWTYVGVASLSESMKPMVGQEWQIFPTMEVDAAFADTLKDRVTQLGADAETELFFLCRSGVRSLAAAQTMTAAGFPRSYNVTGGFEGDPNGEGHRGTVNGWKADGLPWRQG